KRSDAAYGALSSMLATDLGDSFTLTQLSRRPGVSAETVRDLLPHDLRLSVAMSDLNSALADSLYSGYIEAQKATESSVNHNDEARIRAELVFRALSGMSHEMVERVNRARPQTFGEARRIPGLTPAALATLLVHIKSHRKAA